MVNEFVIEDSRLVRNGNPAPTHPVATPLDIRNLGGQGVGAYMPPDAKPHAHLGGDPYALSGGPKPPDTPQTIGGRSWVKTTAGTAGQGNMLQELKLAISLEDPHDRNSLAIILPSSQHYNDVMTLLNENLEALKRNHANEAPAMIVCLPTGKPLNITPLDECYTELMAIYDAMKRDATRSYAASIASASSGFSRGA